MTQRTLTSERRKESRKRPLGLVYVELSAANGGMLRDLSELGFAMRAMMPLHVGEVTGFSFMLDPETRVEGQCKVLWVEEDGRLAGMQFKEVPARQREQVRAWLGEKVVQKAPPESPVEAAKPTLATTMEELREELRTVVARPEAPERDGLELPELREETPEAVTEKPKEAVIDAEAALEILHEVEVATTNPRTENIAAAHSDEVVAAIEPERQLETLPILDETELGREANQAKPWQNRDLVWMAIRMMMVLALIGIAVVYHRPIGRGIIWLGQKVAGEETPEIAPVTKSENLPSEPTDKTEVGDSKATSGSDQESTNAVVAEPTTKEDIKESPTNTAQQPAAVPPVAEKPFITGSKTALPPAPVPLPATNKITTFLPLVTPSPDGGQQEYLAAQEILKDRNAEGRMAEAVKLLWAAVEKGNSGAEVALAQLYRAGRGVSKNCDQTKILLTAAAKKGNAKAQSELNQFLREGCE